MWRKPNETKPSGQVPNAPSAGPSKSQVAQPARTSPPELPVPATEVLSKATAPLPLPAPVVSRAVAATPAAHTASSASVIGAGLKIRGEISGNSDLLIEGEAEGKIRLAGGRVSVGRNGRVQADVDAREIIVEGSVQGNLKATESLHLGASSSVQGSVITPRIGIEDGARLRGKVEMVRTSDSRQVTATEPPAASAVHVAMAGPEGTSSHA